MNNIQKYFQNLLKQGDYNRYVSTLFAPKEKREALSVLYAFNLEIASIRDKVREPMIGEMRIQWWHDGLCCKEQLTKADDEKIGGEGHPILNALKDVIQKYDLPLSSFFKYLDARIFDLYNDPMPTLLEMETYCNDTAGNILQIACTILDKEDSKYTYLASKYGGIAQSMTGLLQLLPFSLAREQCFLATDIIKAVGLDVEKILTKSAQNEEKKRVIQAFVAQARDQYSLFLEQYKQLPPSMKSAFVSVALVPKILKKIEKNGSVVFEKPIDLSPLMRLWIMNKTAFTGKMRKI